LVAAAGLSMIGCDNGTTDPETQAPVPQSVTYISEDSNGNLYKLVITENTNRSARYTAKNGDSFTFTVELFNNGVYSVALTYSGTVESTENSGTEIEINVTVNGEALSITVSGAAMTIISGTIVLDNDDEITITEPLTPFVDKRALEMAINTANTAKEGVVVSVNGTDVLTTVYWVSQARIDTFTTAIATAQAVYDNANADQSMVDYAKIAIETATTVFNGQKQFGMKTEVSIDEFQIYLWESPPATAFTGNGTVYDVRQELVLGSITNGKLTLNLPETIPDAQLELELETSEYPGTVTVSPSDLKTYNLGDNEGFLVDLGNNNVDFLYHVKVTGNYDVVDYSTYIYANKSATISGTYSGTFPGGTFTNSWDLNLEPGWNTVWVHFDYSSSPQVFTCKTDLTGMPTDLLWLIDIGG